MQSVLPVFAILGGILMVFAAAMLLPLVMRHRVRITMVKARGTDLDQLRALCEVGKLRPVIDKTFPLSELAAAHAYSQQGRAGGKILINIGA